jgi:uncharacterized membrane protein
LKIPVKALGLTFLCLGYPFLSSWLLQNGWGRWLLAAFAILLARRALAPAPPWQRLFYSLLGAALGLGAFYAEAFTTRLMPGIAYLSVALLFGHTLAHPPSLIERLVRLQFPHFEPGISEYLRQLTWLWTAFFALNVLICAALAAFAEERTWTLYTGLVVYLLMGLLVCGELLYRPRRFPDLKMPRMRDSFVILMRDGHKVFRELRP